MNQNDNAPRISEEDLRQIDRVFPEGSSFSFVYGCVASQQQGRDIANIVKVLAWDLQQREQRISYSGLKRVVFSGDYYRTLQDLGAEFNRTFTTTREPQAVGMAITNNVPGGCIVTLDGSFAQALVAQDADQRGLAQHVLVHELCHVSDETHSAKVFAAAWLTPAKPLEGRLLSPTLGTWSEYFANRHSSYLVTHPTETTGMLTDALQSVEHDITAALRRYRFDAELRTMMEVLTTKLRFLAQCIGYVAGLLHGLSIALDDLDPKCAAAVRASRVAPHWSMLLAELEQLNACYDEWQNIQALNGLCARWRAITAAFGFHYRTLQDGSLYVDIPCRNDGV